MTSTLRFMMKELTLFQQKLWNAAQWMIETQTVSGIAIAKAKDEFYHLVKRAYDKGENQMTKKLDPKEFAAAIQQTEASEREAHLAQFSQESGLTLTPSEWIAIAQMFCALYQGTEPLLNDVCTVVNNL